MIKVKKKKRVLKNWVKVLLKIIYILLIIFLFHACFKLKERGIKGCMENGYSYEYCVEHS